MALRGTNQELGRPYNRRIVLETIRRHGPVARGEIAELVGLTVQTVSNISRELERQNFIAGVPGPRKTRGYPATHLRINPDGGYAIGLSLTPLGLEAALINLAGEIVAREGRDVPRAAPAAAFREIAAIALEFKKSKSGRRILGAGLAIPGPFGIESMSFVGSTTLEGWKGVPIREELEKAAELPAFIEADHAAAALGERLYGAGKDFRDFYYVYFGVGLGGCMVTDGQPLRGSFHNAGEIGHMPLVPNGEACPCGSRGCLERYVSNDAYQRKKGRLGDEGWIAEAAPLLRSGLAIVENLFDPQTIIVGGIAEGGLIDRLMAKTMPLANTISARRDRTVPRLIRSTAGADAVLRGAAALVVSGVLSPRLGIQGGEGEIANDPMFGRGEAA